MAVKTVTLVPSRGLWHSPSPSLEPNSAVRPGSIPSVWMTSRLQFYGNRINSVNLLKPLRAILMFASLGEADSCPRLPCRCVCASALAQARSWLPDKDTLPVTPMALTYTFSISHQFIFPLF